MLSCHLSLDPYHLQRGEVKMGRRSRGKEAPSAQCGAEKEEEKGRKMWTSMVLWMESLDPNNLAAWSSLNSVPESAFSTLTWTLSQSKEVKDWNWSPFFGWQVGSWTWSDLNSIHFPKWILIKTYFPFKFQQLCCVFHSLFISACGHHTHTRAHTHTDTSHAAPTAACQSMKSRYSVMRTCEISRLPGGGQRHARCNQCKRDFSVSCACFVGSLSREVNKFHWVQNGI